MTAAKQITLGISLLLLVSCGKKADDYKSLITEYKDIICISQNPNSSLTDKTNALSRQLELQKEYTDALSELDNDEKAKFMMQWSVALSEASEGKCN